MEGGQVLGWSSLLRRQISPLGEVLSELNWIRGDAPLWPLQEGMLTLWKWNLTYFGVAENKIVCVMCMEQETVSKNVLIFFFFFLLYILRTSVQNLLKCILYSWCVSRRQPLRCQNLHGSGTHRFWAVFIMEPGVWYIKNHLCDSCLTDIPGIDSYQMLFEAENNSRCTCTHSNLSPQMFVLYLWSLEEVFIVCHQ